MYSPAEARDGNGTCGAINLEIFFTDWTWFNLFLCVVCSLVLDWWLWNTSFSTSFVVLCTLLLLEPPWGEEPLADNCGLVVVPLTGVLTVCGECDGDIGEGEQGM